MRTLMLWAVGLIGALWMAPAAEAAEGDAYAGGTLRASRPACKRIGALRAAAPAPTAGVDTGDFSLSGELGWYSKYAWRGQLITDDPVLQPSVTVGWKELSFNIWANLDLTDVNGNEGELNEVDYTLDWTHTFDTEPFALTLSLGVIYYDFPNTSFDATTEIYAVVSSDMPLNPTFSIYRDIDEIDGTYAALDFSHAFELSANVSLALGAGLGWGSDGYNDGYWGVDDAGYNDFHLSAALPITLGNVSITPSLTWYSLMDELIRDSTSEDDTLVLGISVGFSL